MKKLFSLALVEDDDGMLHIDCDPDPTGEDFDLLIRALGAARQQMQPPVSMTVPPTGSDIPVVPGPPGWFTGNSFPQGPVLGLRHPAFGWLAFQIPDGFLDLLKQALQAIPPESQGRH